MYCKPDFFFWGGGELYSVHSFNQNSLNYLMLPLKATKGHTWMVSLKRMAFYHLLLYFKSKKWTNNNLF